MDTQERQVFERGLRHAAESQPGGTLDDSLELLGWREALTEDPQGAISILFELQGSAGASSSALGDVIAYSLGMDAGTSAGVVIPRLGSDEPPGAITRGEIAVRGLAMGGLRGRELALVGTTTDKGVVIAAVDTKAVALHRVVGLDPALVLYEVMGSTEPAAVHVPDRPDGWAAAVGLGRLAVAHELLGASRTMLQVAREHALGRVQFGQPIASFQAVRHRLADSFVAVESAEAALGAAWDHGSPQAASMAKAVAGHGALTVARNSQQVLAGIGFTAEHPFHRYFRRALALDQVLGSARMLTIELGSRLLEDRRLPDLLPL